MFGDPDSGVMLNYMYKYGDGPETCALWKVSGPVGPIDVPSTAVATGRSCTLRIQLEFTWL